MRRITSILIATVLAGLTLIPLNVAHAGLIKALEFDVDGVLPSAESDIVFFNNTSATESDLYSVSGGVLKQRTIPGGTEIIGNASYLFPNLTPSSGGLLSTASTVLEARINVLAVTSSSPQNSGIGFQAFDGVNRYLMFLTPTGIDLASATGPVSVAFDVLGFNTYRLESPADSDEMRLFVNDVFLQSVTALSTTANGFTFGDGLSPMGNAANADWDFIRISQDIALTSIPVPSTLSLLVLGLLAGLRSCRRIKT